MNTCDTCKWWSLENIADAHALDGYRCCDHPKLSDYGYSIPAVDNAHCYTNERGQIATGPKFGCVHHETK